jgi:hypothetical protein
VEGDNTAIKWGVFDSEVSSKDGWPSVPEDAKWSDLEVGVEVLEVRSEVGSLKGDSACRSSWS